MSWGEMMVLALVGLFVLGPERLPAAIRWVTALLRHVHALMAAATEQLESPELAELRAPLEELREPLADLRAADPRRVLRGTVPATGTGTTAPSAPTTRRPDHDAPRDPARDAS